MLSLVANSGRCSKVYGQRCLAEANDVDHILSTWQSDDASKMHGTMSELVHR